MYARRKWLNATPWKAFRAPHNVCILCIVWRGLARPAEAHRSDLGVKTGYQAWRVTEGDLTEGRPSLR